MNEATETDKAKRSAETETAEPFGPGVTWTQVIRRHDRQGGHYFSGDTMAFHNSRLNGTPEVGPGGAAYGVVSSKAPPTGRPGNRTEEPRRYQVIRCVPDGTIQRPHPEDNPHGGFALRFTDRAAALKARDALTRGPTDKAKRSGGGPDDPTTPGGSVPPDYYRWY